MTEQKLLELKKRESCFVQYPQKYGIACDVCGGENLHWSEFDHLIWCYDCEKDTKGTSGIFDGPVPVELCRIMGISFDKINIITGNIIPSGL